MELDAVIVINTAPSYCAIQVGKRNKCPAIPFHSRMRALTSQEASGTPPDTSGHALPVEVEVSAMPSGINSHGHHMGACTIQNSHIAPCQFTAEVYKTFVGGWLSLHAHKRRLKIAYTRRVTHAAGSHLMVNHHRYKVSACENTLASHPSFTVQWTSMPLWCICMSLHTSQWMQNSVSQKTLEHMLLTLQLLQHTTHK